ncbi:hypothetical protein D9M69_656070 [compost metagenome]
MREDDSPHRAGVTQANGASSFVLAFRDASHPTADVFREVRAVVETNGHDGEDELAMVRVDPVLRCFGKQTAYAEVPKEYMYQWRNISLVLDEGEYQELQDLHLRHAD